jgi:hypothetical protein
MKPSERIDMLLDDGCTLETAIKITLNELSEMPKNSVGSYPKDYDPYAPKKETLFDQNYDELKKQHETLRKLYTDMQVLYLEQSRKEISLQSEIEKLNIELSAMRKRIVASVKN